MARSRRGGRSQNRPPVERQMGKVLHECKGHERELFAVASPEGI
jgi:hypothetical protein